MFFYRELEQHENRTALILPKSEKLSYSELTEAAKAFNAAVSERSLVSSCCVETALNPL